MTATAFQNLKPGDEVEVIYGRLRGVRGVVTGHVGDGCHIRVNLSTGIGIFARATTVRLVRT